MNDRFVSLLKEAPPFLSALDLVKIGLFSTNLAVYKAKERGEAPPSVQVSQRKLRFPKDELVSWLNARGQGV